MLKKMPEKGSDWTDLKGEMIERGSGDAKWREGKTAVYVFNAGEDVAQVQKEAYTMYMSENGLGPLAFPSLKQMEDEVVGMGLALLNGNDQSTGTITSGGTDSITMAVKAARDFAFANKTIADQPNIVAPWSVHPAFDKAAKMMSLEVRRIPVADNLLADVNAMSEAIDGSTIMLVGSAPSFPYGLIDPIEELGALAKQKDVWLHVDACVGGYIAPFVRMNGVDIPPFDFEVDSVKSISADLHKYGYCAKGASTVFFRDEELYQYMIFDCDNWPGGRMITPTLAGTRPGGAISAAWAVMNYLGVEGYCSKHKQVTDARQAVETGVKQLGFDVLGSPQLGIIAFSHRHVNVFAIYKQMYKKGWFTSLTTEPKALHLMLSPIHKEVTSTYLDDLKASIEIVRAGNSDSVKEARYS
ncbi:MAG: aspartate aminotransferase family protein [Gammaproteobacteria bacterium]|nr:aspartate aminotransferase family protein [Gammaproteobacteria bacterium]